MSSRRSRPLAVLAMAAFLFLAPGCIGPNNTVGQLAKWNMSFENKWSKEGVFILILPGYALAGIGDMVIFNSIQWWTGTNPIPRPTRNNGPQF
jgi:hypothetical protein